MIIEEVFVPKFIPRFKTEPKTITFDLEAEEKSGIAQNVTLPVP